MNNKKTGCDHKICDGSGIIMVATAPEIADRKIASWYDGRAMLCRCHKHNELTKPSGEARESVITRVTGYNRESIAQNLFYTGRLITPEYEELLDGKESEEKSTKYFPNPIATPSDVLEKMRGIDYSDALIDEIEQLRGLWEDITTRRKPRIKTNKEKGE